MSCPSGKQPVDPRITRRALNGLRAEYPRLRLYYCRMCGGWHFTSNNNHPTVPAEQRRAWWEQAKGLAK